MGTTVVAIREVHRVVTPGVASTVKGQRGTPPVTKVIPVGTKFVVDDDTELAFLKRTKSVKEPETPAQIAEAEGNMHALQRGAFAEGGDKPKAKRGEITTETDKPAKGRGRGRSKAASDLI